MRWSRGFAIVAAIAASLPFLAATPSRADGWHGGHYHGGYRYRYHRVPAPRVAIGVGPAFGFWWGPGWYGPPPYYYPPYSPYYAAPPIVLEAPPAYIERPPAPEAPQSFWYYCPSAQAYYPTAPTCDEPWVKVPARPQ